ncbi:MAG: hypothetical protein KJO90_00195 [Eudoraea sp.]|nr:hypothetical protein [Eudoraea sp.]
MNYNSDTNKPKISNNKYVIFLAFCLLVVIGSSAQIAECTLGLGGKDTEVIYQVFKLDDEQKAIAEALVASYQKDSRLIQEQVDHLFESYPQRTPEELQKMAKKFDSLKVELTNMSRNYDQKLVGLFNQKQYEVYLKLCNEVMKRPLAPAQK